MCTVTYLPQGNDHFLLTSNRDEMPSRSPRSITVSEFAGQKLAFPRDEMAGGTWLAVSDHNRLACLLNGAFERHDRNPPYRMSRGVMVLEYFTYRDTADFLQCSVKGVGDHILAASFLAEFVENDIPWVHIDLAAGDNEGGLAHVASKFTGFGVRFTISAILDEDLFKASL